MSYQVLARKWRPQTFADVIGQSGITQTLANAIRLDRIGHAFLFCGSRGIGKTTAARILAKALNCELGPTPEPCNACRHCREITAGNAMDVIEIDGASNRGIDEIRQLRENVRYTPATARFKVIIIDEVHMLTREAFNALLKTLEEPPAHAKFILATTEAHKVPVTIVSRCQRYDFRRIDTATLVEFLRDMCRKEAVTIEDRTLDVLARMADGGLRDSLSLLDQVISFSGTTIDHDKVMKLLGRIDPQLLLDVFRALASENAADALRHFADYIDGGGNEQVFNREMMELTRDILAMKMGAPPRNTLPGDLVNLFTVDQLERIFKILLDQEQTFRQTEFPRLLMDVTLVKIAMIRPLIPIEDILGRLRQLTTGSPGTLPANPSPGTRPPALSRPTVPRPTPSRPANPAESMDTVKKNPHSNNKTPPNSLTSPAIPTPMPMTPPPPSPTPSTATPQSTTVQTSTASTASPPTTSAPTPAPVAALTSVSPATPAPTRSENKPDTNNTPLRQLMESLDNTHAPLRGMLSFAAVDAIDNQTLAIVFHPDYRFHYDLFEKDADAIPTLEKLTGPVLGSSRRIVCRLGGRDTPRAIIDQDLLAQRLNQEKRLNLARSRPEVERVVKMFRGDIRDVQLKKPAPPTDRMDQMALVDTDNLEEEEDDE
ncbi:DNA polymerase III subunit gamma/tau [bacterium]|nr:DNA polymerase III subunit gamma/tau [candidate division CSSED10-310 bacterium]